ncbi:MAG: ABC transporter permease [Eubacterium sp.]|nr:ABC transporter permease [Eubacterium sp.]
MRKRTGNRFAGHFILVILILFWVAMFILNRNFRSVANLASILTEATITGTAALGMTFVILLGDFDLSIGSMLALLGMLLVFVSDRTGLVVGILVTCLAGIVLGAINGGIIVYGNVSAFITTLGTYYGYRSLAYISNNARTLMVGNSSLLAINRLRLFGIPASFFLMVILTVILWFVLNQTVYGRSVKAIGNSIQASRISGIHIERTKLLTFALVGLCTSFATVLMTSRPSFAAPDVATDFHFQAITVVILGGTKMTGGEGDIWNTFFAALLYASISNCLNLYHVDAQWQRICMGLILLLAFSLERMKTFPEWLRGRRTGAGKETTSTVR